MSRQESLRLHVAVVLHVGVDDVQRKSLDKVIELVLVQVRAESLHGEVGPVRELDTKSVVVVLDGVEALLQQREVQRRIQAVAGDAQISEVARLNMRVVLLLRQVFYSASDWLLSYLRTERSGTFGNLRCFHFCGHCVRFVRR